MPARIDLRSAHRAIEALSARMYQFEHELGVRPLPALTAAERASLGRLAESLCRELNRVVSESAGVIAWFESHGVASLAAATLRSRVRITVDIPASLMGRIELARAGARVEAVIVDALRAAFPFTAPNHGEAPRRRANAHAANHHPEPHP